MMKPGRLSFPILLWLGFSFLITGSSIALSGPPFSLTLIEPHSSFKVGIP